MFESLETELLNERVDSLNIANEELRERLEAAHNQLAKVTVNALRLEQHNKDLSKQIDRLRLHIQQGIEL
jgi:predicted  nucleic acid-binding Zn-ribbon protein